MSYLNFLVSASLLMITFLGIQKNIKTLNCVSDIAFKKHRNNLQSLIFKTKRFPTLKACPHRVQYQVSLKGSVTNE